MRAALIIATSIALFSDAAASPPTAKFSVAKTSRFKPAPLVTTPLTPAVDAGVVLSIQSLDAPVRKEQEQILLELLKNTPDHEAEEKADYRFRLGEFYAKQTRAFRKQGDATKAAEALLHAKAMYQALLDSPAFASFPRADEAVFFYAYTLHTAGKDGEARPIFDRILKNYPNSKFAPEALLVRADALFAATKLADADLAYQMVHKHPRPYTTYSRYKRAYILLAQQKPAAYQAFVDVATDDDGKVVPLTRAIRLGRLHALVQQNKISTEVGDLEDLAALYADRGKHERAAASYRALIKAQPDHAELCTWQLGVAKATVQATATSTIEICTSDVDAFKGWATAVGFDVK